MPSRDVRHTFASLLVSGGASLEMISRLPGHTQIGTTQRFAHLIDSPLRVRVDASAEIPKPSLKLVAGRDEAFEGISNVHVIFPLAGCGD